MGQGMGIGLEMEWGMGYGGGDGAKELGMEHRRWIWGWDQEWGWGREKGKEMAQGRRWGRGSAWAGYVPPGCNSSITDTPWLLANCSPSVCSDISPLLKDPVAFKALIDLLEDHLRASFPRIDVIAGGCSVRPL